MSEKLSAGNINYYQEILKKLKTLREKFIEKGAFWQNGSQQKVAEIGKQLDDIEAIENEFKMSYEECLAVMVKALPPEILKNFQDDLDECIISLKDFYGLLKESKNFPGRYYYEADYDGRIEFGGRGEDFTGQRFYLPEVKQIFSWITAKQFYLYEKMKIDGLEPKLQIVPLGFKIDTLMRILNDKVPETVVIVLPNNKLKLEENYLLYEPENLTASIDGEEIMWDEGKSKSQWIKENQGWQIKIVATKRELDGDSKIIYEYEDPNPKEQSQLDIRTLAQQLVLHWQEMKKQGYSGLSLESTLITQMNLLRNGNFIDKKNMSAITESLSSNNWIIAVLKWNGPQMSLTMVEAFSSWINLRVRPSINILRPGRKI